MLKMERQQLIEKELQLSGSILISQMSKKIDFSEETIRRDLKEMEQKNILTRIHGGAYINDKYNEGVPISLRETFCIEEKDRLSNFIVENHIHHGDTIMLDASTTCYTLVVN